MEENIGAIKNEEMIINNSYDSITAQYVDAPNEDFVQEKIDILDCESLSSFNKYGIIIIGKDGHIACCNDEAQSILFEWKYTRPMVPVSDEISNDTYKHLLARHGYLPPVIKKIFQAGQLEYSFSMVPLLKPNSLLDDLEIVQSMLIIERMIPDELSFLSRTQRYNLSPREVDVARLLVLGKSDKVIKREIGVSIYTVREHLRHIRQKMGVSSRLEIVSVLLSK